MDDGSILEEVQPEHDTLAVSELALYLDLNPTTSLMPNYSSRASRISWLL